MGGDNAVLIEIIIFAMIAAFLVHRLRSVLGRRTGEERQRPNPFSTSDEAAPSRDNVIQLPNRQRGEPAEREARDADPASDEPLSLAARINQVRDADGGFEEKSFLSGARAAFEMIVQAFAAGDLASLRPLLSDEVFANFARAVKDRQAAGETLETRIAAIRDADLADARLEGSVAFITIRFVSDQTNVTKDVDGRIVDGDPNQPIEVIDLWTFARNVRSRDPNWTLVETRAPS